MPFLRVGFEAAFDQVLGVRGHIRPLWLGELVLAGPDPLLHARGYGEPMVGVERGESTQSEKMNKSYFSNLVCNIDQSPLEINLHRDI